MIIVCLTIFSSILSPFQWVSYIKFMIIVCLTIFLFDLVTISAGELHSVIIVSLTFSLHSFIISACEFHKLHYSCVFDCFLFDLVTISVGELHKVHDYCVFDYFLFNLVTISGRELHKVHN